MSGRGWGWIGLTIDGLIIIRTVFTVRIVKSKKSRETTTNNNNKILLSSCSVEREREELFGD